MTARLLEPTETLDRLRQLDPDRSYPFVQATLLEPWAQSVSSYGGDLFPSPELLTPEVTERQMAFQRVPSDLTEAHKQHVDARFGWLTRLHTSEASASREAPYEYPGGFESFLSATALKRTVDLSDLPQLRRLEEFAQQSTIAGSLISLRIIEVPAGMSNGAHLRDVLKRTRERVTLYTTRFDEEEDFAVIEGYSGRLYTPIGKSNKAALTNVRDNFDIIREHALSPQQTLARIEASRAAVENALA